MNFKNYSVMKRTIFLCGFLWASLALLSQTNINMGGSTHTVTGCHYYIYDNGGPNGNYGANRMDSLTIFPATGEGAVAIVLDFTDIAEDDTLFFFNGPSTASEPINPNGQPISFSIGTLGTNWVNNSNFYMQGGDFVFYATVQNPTGAITILFKSNAANNRQGFKLRTFCMQPCQRIYVDLDTLLTTPKPHQISDTTDENYYIDVCPGDTVHFVANCTFLDNGYGYTQSIDSCIFQWNFGDTTIFSSGTSEIDHIYPSGRGYNFSVTAKDQKGCPTIMPGRVRIRTSWNPIEEIVPYRNICVGDTLPITIGNRLSSSIKIKPLESIQQSSLSVDSVVKLPDGTNCGPTPCFYSPVTFTSFNLGAEITAGSDILSVCARLQHTFYGDLKIALKCPNGTEVELVHYYQSGSYNLGVPPTSGSSACNPVLNQAWDYCWSVNDDYIGTLWGELGSHVVYVNGNATCDSSHRYGLTNYYTPPTLNGNSFNNFIGCPLNGTWELIVCDYWGIDAGILTNWELALDSRLLSADWGYKVTVDSINVDGPGIYVTSPFTANLVPTESGLLTYQITLIDNLGCKYDTNTTLKVTPSPEPEIGEDVSICTGDVASLTASNVSEGSVFYWNNGMTTQSINAVSGDTYIVEVTSTYLDTVYNRPYKCKGYDTVTVTVNPTPFAAFSIENTAHCAPAELKLKNETIFALHPGTPVENVGATYQWYVWDENWNLYLSSTLFEPEFILENPGSYHVMLYVYTSDGCKDSLMKYYYLQVFQQPQAEFIATPEAQMLSDGGIVYFHNFTDTLLLSNPNTTWYWDFGDGTIDTSAFSPEHTYETWGDYDIIFYVRSENGCADQISHRITIEENITFPNNIITPNGDGLNDVFVIGGLNTYINPDDAHHFRENTLTIYDRWGKKVYEAKNYDTYLNTEGEVIVGKKAFGGEKCPDGTYYFTFYYKGKVKTYHLNGTIMIVRENK